MLMYGICMRDVLNSINWKDVISMLKEYDTYLYTDFLRDFGTVYTTDDVRKWVDKYRSMGYFGLEAFLRDVIKKKENIRLDIVDSDDTYLGLLAGAPWDFNSLTKKLSKSEFDNMLQKHLTQIVKNKVSIKWWNVSCQFIGLD